MKKPPTLADACIATMLDKSMAGGPRGTNVAIWALYKCVLEARKFVLDNSMSQYFADLSQTFWRGGQRQRIRAIENVRRMARLPHQKTWIEFDNTAYVERLRTAYGVRFKTPAGEETAPGRRTADGCAFPPRIGFLFFQHAHCETAFLATEFYDTLVHKDRGAYKPLSVAWCTDDTPSPFRRLDCYGDADAELLVRMKGYKSPNIHFVHAHGYGDDAKGILDFMRTQPFLYAMPSIAMRDLWALLATINDLPVTIERVEPSKGYLARGSYKKFLKHSVVHLVVPETKWRKLVAKTAALLRRRAHLVRGHWRQDWRHPLSPLCSLQEFDDQMVCRHCSGHKIWVHEHQRGDTSLGFVTHDYEVHHQNARGA